MYNSNQTLCSNRRQTAPFSKQTLKVVSSSGGIEIMEPRKHTFAGGVMCYVSQYNPQKAVLPVEVRSGMQQRARASSRHCDKYTAAGRQRKPEFSVVSKQGERCAGEEQKTILFTRGPLSLDVDAKRYETVMMRIPLVQYLRPGSTRVKNDKTRRYTTLPPPGILSLSESCKGSQ